MGTLDTFELEVDWGDGNTETFTYPSGTVSLGETHQYVDDASTQSSGQFTVGLTLRDDDGGQDSTALEVAVGNVAPTPKITGPATVVLGSAVTLTAEVDDPGPDTHTFAWLVTNGDGPLASGEDQSFTFTPPAIGPLDVTLTVTDDEGDVGNVAVSIEVTEFSTRRVTELRPTISGVRVQIDGPIDISSLNLYDGPDASVELPNVTLIGDNVGLIQGSIVHDPLTNTLVFVKTGGALAPDRYTLTIRSGPDGLRGQSGDPFDGDADGTPGGDFVGVFHVADAEHHIVSLPDIARGPGQPLEPGVAVSIDNADGVTMVEVEIAFDPSALQITGATIVSDLEAAGWTIENDLVAAATGVVKINIAGTAPLQGTDVQLFELQGFVPAEVSYGQLRTVEFARVAINGGAIDALGDSAVLVVALLGDADGSGQYSAFDAFLVASVAVGLSSGFDAFDTVDPTILSDVTGDGSVSGFDAAFVAQRAAGQDVPQLSGLPVAAAASSHAATQAFTATGQASRRALVKRVPAVPLASRSTWTTADTDDVLSTWLQNEPAQP